LLNAVVIWTKKANPAIPIVALARAVAIVEFHNTIGVVKSRSLTPKATVGVSRPVIQSLRTGKTMLWIDHARVAEGLVLKQCFSLMLVGLMFVGLFDISLIIEYVGEVLTDEQSVQRLIDAQKQGARHVYMMQLDNGKTTVAMHCVLLIPLLWLWLWLWLFCM